MYDVILVARGGHVCLRICVKFCQCLPFPDVTFPFGITLENFLRLLRKFKFTGGFGAYCGMASSSNLICFEMRQEIPLPSTASVLTRY